MHSLCLSLTNKIAKCKADLSHEMVAIAHVEVLGGRVSQVQEGIDCDEGDGSLGHLRLDVDVRKGVECLRENLSDRIFDGGERLGV